MVKVLKIIFCAFLLIASFFAGVSYSDQVREVGNWLFESKSEEIDFDSIEQEQLPGQDSQSPGRNYDQQSGASGQEILPGAGENIEPAIIMDNENTEVNGAVPNPNAEGAGPQPTPALGNKEVNKDVAPANPAVAPGNKISNGTPKK